MLAGPFCTPSHITSALPVIRHILNHDFPEADFWGVRTHLSGNGVYQELTEVGVKSILPK
jgi:hypothetical protein